METSKSTKVYFIAFAVIFMFSLVVIASYSFFRVGNLNVNNVANLNVVLESGNMVFDVVGGQTSLNVTVANMGELDSGNIAAENNTTLTITFQSNTEYSMVCTYDIIYEWTSSDKYQAHTQGVTGNEYTMQGTLTLNEHVFAGENRIANERDTSDVMANQNSKIVVSGAQIDAIGSTPSTAVWDFSLKFYNLDVDQTALSDKTYNGRFKVDNVSCMQGTKSTSLVDFLINDAPRSGTDAVSNSPWILTSDHTDEWRYAGKNPDNYIQFNDELWRIIGVMPNMTYCTGMYGDANECDTTSTGSLIKIIRNQNISNDAIKWDVKDSVGSSIVIYSSNDWSDSQLMLMLNGTNYLKTGYDVNGTKLHTSYSIVNNMVKDANGYNFYNATYSYLDGTGTTVYVPSGASTSSYTATSGTLYKKIESGALNQIATVKWDLYGKRLDTPQTDLNPSIFYNIERNINNLGTVCTNASLPENRPVYWYGKIGLMYPSDFGYATNGGTTYNRAACLGYSLYNWGSDGDYADCSQNDWLLFSNITSTAPWTTGSWQWTITPLGQNSSDTVFRFTRFGQLSTSRGNTDTERVKPSLYLKADTIFTGGTGTWNDPYTIKTEIPNR